MKVSLTSETVNKRYLLLEKLGSGGMGAVFRASDKLTHQVVALKRVLTSLEQQETSPSSETSDLKLALSREFRTLASLRHPHIVTVIDYGFTDDQQPYFTMGLLENARTLLEAARDQSKTERVRLLAQLLQALIYLHRRGILHRDLKPGNVLVDAHNTVKVLDFGLSFASSLSVSNMQSGMAGTLAYMAPELFMEEQATVASDLYAFGVVAYELFAGQTPFYSKNIGLMINSILSAVPNWSSIDPDIHPVVERLLAKSPAERYANAEETLWALCDAAGYSLPMETVAIRESFLQSAPLVGRKEEFKRLSEVIKETIRGKGSIWLIGGESGVGKSRLLDEVRIQALVKGAMVLRGQAVSDGNTPYHIWRDVVRMLLLAAPPEDDQAAVLKAIVPDIAALLDREIDDAPPLKDGNETQARLFNVLESLLRSQTQPILILLEDLQWAGSESLALVNYLVAVVPELPLAIIGDYRDDEQPNLPQMLRNIPVIRLNRLSKEGIAELSLAMLGAAGKRGEVLDLLHRETEGNAFFLVEVVRALAEEAGQLENIGRLTLPQKVFAGGVRSIIERRLHGITGAARALLQMAAVIGRRLDLEVLAALAPDLNLDDWLTMCVNAAVINIQDEKWRFAHSKLRDTLIEAIPDVERPESYRRIAQAVESIRADAPDYIATLAHLWNIAGAQEKELQYVRAAGFQAFQANASNEAIPYFNRAIELIQHLRPEGTERTQQELGIQIPLSVAMMQTRGFTTPDVENAWHQSRVLCDQLGKPPQLVGVLFGLCGVYTISGQHHLGIAMDAEILSLAPLTPYPNATRMQAYYTKTNTHIALGEVKEAIESANQVLAYYDPAEAQYAIAMYGVNPGIAAKIWIAFGQQVMGYPDQALQTLEAALGEARALGHPFTLATSLSFAWIHQLRRDPETAFELVKEGNNLANEYGFRFYQMVGMPLLGWSMAQQGNTQEGLDILEQSLGMMQGSGIVYLRNYFLGLLAECYAATGRSEEALTTLKEVLDPAQKASGQFYDAEIHRMWGELLQAQGDPLEAEAHFMKALDKSREHDMRLFELRAAISLARLWQSQGKAAEGRARLNSIYTWFTEGFDTADLQAAQALLAELA